MRIGQLNLKHADTCPCAECTVMENPTIHRGPPNDNCLPIHLMTSSQASGLAYGLLRTLTLPTTEELKARKILEESLTLFEQELYTNLAKRYRGI